MKKIILLTSLFLFTTSIIHAQINKGSVLLGGGIGFGSNKIMDTDKKSSYISLSPAIGIAVKQNFIIGVNLIYGHSKNNFNSPGSESHSNSYGGAIFLRKYLILGKGFFLFGETGISSQTSTITNTFTSDKNEQKIWGLSVYLYPGLSYAVNKRFHLEAGLPQLANIGFSQSKTIVNGVTTERDSGISGNFSTSSFTNVNFGFRFFLSK